MPETIIVTVEYDFNQQDILVENKVIPYCSTASDLVSLLNNDIASKFSQYICTKILLYDRIEYKYKPISSEIFFCNSRVKVILVSYRFS
jgi:hypothetical protein